MSGQVISPGYINGEFDFEFSWRMLENGYRDFADMLEPVYAALGWEWSDGIPAREGIENALWRLGTNVHRRIKEECGGDFEMLKDLKFAHKEWHSASGGLEIQYINNPSCPGLWMRMNIETHIFLPRLNEVDTEE